MIKMRNILTVCVIILAFATMAWGGVPELLSYQGRLTITNDGEPINDGSYELTFAIYNVATAGVPLWSETHLSVPVTDGLFSVVLGSTQPMDDAVFSSSESFLEVQYNGNPLSPRTQLTSSPYAQRIATVDGAKGGEMTGELTIYPESATLTRGNLDAFTAAGLSRISISFLNDDPTISFWEPVDSKGSSELVAVKKLEMSQDGIILFGATDSDTNLIVSPNGDIVGVGQITMGQNSSSGINTTVLGFENVADGDSSTIGGGSANLTTGTSSVISGGFSNTANGEGSTIGGGSFHVADGPYSTIGGGYNNSAGGAYSTIPGGHDNVADGDHSFASGYMAMALHGGSFVWADETGTGFSSTADNQFIVRASGGVGIGTDSPTGLLDVVGTPGDGSVNLPADAIAAPEIFDEPGLAVEQSLTDVSLTQGTGVMVTVAAATITIPSGGFVVVRGNATLEGSGTSKRNQAYLQIDDTEGGGINSPYYSLAGGGDHDTPSSSHYSNISVERVYNLPAGTYTFYLEAMAHPGNDGDASIIVQRPFIIATYFPTAYGTVSN